MLAIGGLFPLTCSLFCCQGVWEERGERYCGSGQPGVCERSHGGLHQWADPLLLPGAQESPGRSRLLLWQLVLHKAMTPPSPPVLFIRLIKPFWPLETLYNTYIRADLPENSEHAAANHIFKDHYCRPNKNVRSCEYLVCICLFLFKLNIYK